VHLGELRLVAQLGGPVPQRRQHQVGLLAVEPAAREHRLRLDQQDRLVRAVEEVRTELVGEAPPPGVRCAGGERGQRRVVLRVVLDVSRRAGPHGLTSRRPSWGGR
jgi:hypothetical protein